MFRNTGLFNGCISSQSMLGYLLAHSQIQGDAVSREFKRFFWCYRESLACLRRVTGVKHTSERLQEAEAWMLSVVDAIESGSMA